MYDMYDMYMCMYMYIYICSLCMYIFTGYNIYIYIEIHNVISKTYTGDYIHIGDGDLLGVVSPVICGHYYVTHSPATCT